MSPAGFLPAGLFLFARNKVFLCGLAYLVDAEDFSMTAPRRPTGTGSLATISGYPLHSTLSPIAIGALVTAFGADIALMVTAEPFWGEAAKWLLLGALLFGLLAAMFGFVGPTGVNHTRISLGYRIGDALVLIVTGANYLLRTSGDAGMAGSYGIILTGTAVLLVMLTGLFGDGLGFRNGIEVTRAIEAGETNPEFLPGGRPDLERH